MKKYIRTARMEKAMRLLIDHDWRETDVALEVGYDLSHFINDFKRFTGLTPKAFQKNNRPS